MSGRGMAWALLLAVGAANVAACGQNAATEAQTAAGGVEVSDARMILNAVSGRPAAIYFSLINKGDRAITLRGVSVEGAGSAEMHSYQEWDGQMVMGEMAPVSVQPGESISFAPGGQHIMAMQVSPQLQAGGKTNVTLKLLGGGTHVFPAAILPAGSAEETAPPLPARVPAESPAPTR